MRQTGFATLVLLVSIASTTRIAAAQSYAGVYLAVEDGLVQYVDIGVSGNVASGFLEVVRSDEKAAGALNSKQIALTGIVQGRTLVFGSWTVDTSEQRLVITYPTQGGSLRQARFERSSVTEVNAAVAALRERALHAQGASQRDEARHEFTGALALAAANTVAFTRLQVALEISVAKRIAAKQQADQASFLAEAKHAQAEAALQVARDSGSVRTAALQVQSAMYVDVAAGRAQAYLTQAESEIASTTDDLAVLKGHIESLQRRMVYLRGVIAQRYAQSNAARGRLKSTRNEYSPGHTSLGIIINP